MSGVLAASCAGKGSSGYDVILIAGQSNAVGYGGPIDLVNDVGGAKAFQYANSGANINTIIPAIEPLCHPDTGNLTADSGNPSIGFPVAFARQYLSHTGRKLLLVPAAYQGTALVATNYWQPGGTGFEFAVSSANSAMAAGGSGSVFKGILWHQGENDAVASIPTKTYAHYLDATIAAFRSRITGAANSWFIVGQMVPWEINSSGNATIMQAIDAAHADTPNRVARSAYWTGDTGTIGAIHYNAASQRINGGYAYTALTTLPNATHAPGKATGLTLSNSQPSQITLSWSDPASGSIVTDYLVEYSIHGVNSWATFSHAFLATNAVDVTGLTQNTSYDFRVTAQNAAGYGTASDIATSSTTSSTGIWDSAKTATSIVVLSNSNRTASIDSITPSTWGSFLGDVGKSSGKWYFEVELTAYSTSPNYNIFGIATTNGAGYLTYSGQWATSLGFQGTNSRFRNGFTVGVAQDAALVALNDIGRIAVDFTSGKVWTSCTHAAGAFQNGGDPASGANPCETFTPGATFYQAGTLYGQFVGNAMTLLTPANYVYAIPSGFSAWG